MGAYQAAPALFRQIGSRLSEANTFLSLGRLARRREDISAARTYAQAALDVYRTMDNAWNTALALEGLGLVERDAGDVPAARAYYREALALLECTGAPSAAKVRAQLQALENK